MKRLLPIHLLLLLALLLACGSERERPAELEETEPPAATGAASATDVPPPTATPVPPTPAPTATPIPGPRPVSVVGQDGSLVMGTDGMAWWNDTVFYEIFVRSFYDSDGDGIGDLRGVIEKLDYLNDGDPATDDDLGVTGIWLMPITDATSYHGYDTVDYRAIDPDYGTVADFQALMEAAHQRGIRVIVDLVLNHTGREHPWFQASQDPDSEFRDWYLWEDENPNFLGPDGQTVWHRGEQGYYYGVFWGGMPDLNYASADVTAEMYDVTRYWLEEMGADGFRLDAIKHLVEQGALQENTAETYAWWADYYAFYKEIDPEAFTVGEAWTSTPLVARYIDNGVDIAFEFDLALAMMSSASSQLNIDIANAMEEGAGVLPANQYGTFLTNHDQNRVMSQLDGVVGQAKAAASMLLTGPGVPFIYYGEEIGMEGVKPDELIRRPMQWAAAANGGFSVAEPWQPLDGNYQEVNVELQNEEADSLLNHYRALIALRNEHEALRLGEYAPLDTDSIRLYAFLRWSDEERVLVLINLSDREITADDYALSRPDGPLDVVESAWLLLGGEGQVAAPMVSAGGGVEPYTPFESVAPYTTYVIQLQ